MKLKDIAEISAGQGAPQGDNNYCNDGTPFVKAGDLFDLLNGKDIFDIQKVSDGVAKSHKLKLYKKGTILFAKSGMSCLKGYVYVLPCNSYVVSHLACITPKDDISEYLKLYFTYNKPNKLIKDNAYPSISLADIGNLDIDIKDNQRDFTNIINKLNSIITLREKQLQKLDLLIKARFGEMFGDVRVNSKKWEMRLIGELVSKQTLNGFFAKPSLLDDNGKYGMISVADIVNYRCANINNLKRVNITEKEFSKFKVEYGDLLFCRSSLVATGIGKASFVPFYSVNNIFECHIIKISLDINLVVPEFVQELTLTEYFRNEMMRKSKTATMTTIGQKDILNTFIIVPPLDIQLEFKKFLDKVCFVKQKIELDLEKERTFFDCLMQNYFCDGEN